MSSSIEQIFNFKENTEVAFTHQLRVFIMGVDVTPWIKGAVTVTYGNRDSYNTTSFELSNPHQIWQVTRDNAVNSVFRLASGEYSEEAKKKVWNWKIKNNTTYELDIQTSIFGQRGDLKKATSSLVLSDAYTLPNDFDTSNTKEFKYRLAINDCIFNRHDVVRIFAANPLSPLSANQWMEVFCGFVQDHPISTDYINGASSLRINCYDIRQIMTKMRASINSFTGDTDPQPLFTTDFYRNFENSPSTHAFSGSSLENTIKELVLGTSVEDLEARSREKENLKGVGSFKLGNTVCYDPKNPGDTLLRWHLMSLFGVNKVPFPTGKSSDAMWLTSEEVNIIGANTVRGPLDINNNEKVVAGPLGRYLHFLLPTAGTGAGTLVQFTNETTPRAREFVSRWDVIRDFAEKLDFQVMVSPSGDLLVEFPQYSFAPSAYTATGSKNTVNVNSDVRGIHNLLTFDKHQKEDTLNDEAEDFPTIIRATGGMALSNTQITPTIETFVPVSYVYSPVLVDRYGVIMENMDIPYVGQRSHDYDQNLDRSPIIRRLTLLALLEYQKRIADASTLEGSVVFRPFLLPNRPVHFKKSARIGVLTSVSNTWAVNTDAKTAVSMHMLMAERKDGTFRLLTGAFNTPIDYGSIWGENDEGSSLAGIRTKSSDDQINSASQNKNGASPGASKAGNAKRDSSVTQPAIRSLETLYCPFKDRVAKFVAAARKRLENDERSVEVGETFRTPLRQNELKRSNPSATKAEGMLSYHQYGLAADIYIFEIDKATKKKKISNDVRLYQELYNINVELFGDDRLVAAMANPGFPKGDLVHYQIPKSWSLGSSKFKEIFESEVSRGVPPAEAVKKVWKAIDSRRLAKDKNADNATSACNSQPPPFDVTHSTAGTLEFEAAPPCTSTSLTQPGLKRT